MGVHFSLVRFCFDDETLLNRVQFETRSTNLRKSPKG
jgi:hypothetical protein